MESIAEKLKLLNCPTDMYSIAYKHIVSLNLISLEELEKILRLLLTKRIITPKNGKILVEPADFCVLANGFDVIIARINEMETVVDELDAYKEKLIRINSRSAIANLLTMKQMEEPYKTPEGKYSKVPFSIRRFQNKYSGISLPSNYVEITPEEKIEEPVKEENIEILNPVIDSLNAYQQALDGAQTQALNDVTFERFERLTDSTRRVLNAVYGVDEVNDSITDNLIKLVTSDVVQASEENNDADVILAAITYHKKITAEEVERIQKCIADELEYANGMDVELGRAA